MKKSSILKPSLPKKNSPGVVSYLRLLKPPLNTKTTTRTETSPLSSDLNRENPLFFHRKPIKTVEKVIEKEEKNLSESKTHKNKATTIYTLNLLEKQRHSPLKPKEKSRNCCYHPTKKAKYMRLTEDTASSEELDSSLFFCSKCAIDLALKGIRVVDLTNENEHEPNPIITNKLVSKPSEKCFLSSKDSDQTHEKIEITKKDHLEKFLKKLEKTNNKGNQLFAMVNLRRNEVKNLSEKEITRITSIFDVLIKQIDSIKHSILQKISNNNSDEEECLLNHINQISSSLKDMGSIKSDITANHNNIVKEMDWKPFETILAKYEQKISVYEGVFENLTKENNEKEIISVEFEKDNKKIEENIWKIIAPKINTQKKINNSHSEIYVSFDNKEIFEENEKKCASSPNTQKFLELLQKINNNQENTMKNCKKIKVFESDLFRSADKKGGEEQFHRFFEKIENKISEEILKTPIQSQNYQKSLFCSPHFKENREIII